LGAVLLDPGEGRGVEGFESSVVLRTQCSDSGGNVGFEIDAHGLDVDGAVRMAKSVDKLRGHNT